MSWTESFIDLGNTAMQKMRTFVQSVGGNNVEVEAVSLVDPEFPDRVQRVNTDGEALVHDEDAKTGLAAILAAVQALVLYGGVPYFIADGTTKTVPENIQHVIVISQTLEGDSILDGDEVFL